jgi:hypothetical protein
MNGDVVRAGSRGDVDEMDEMEAYADADPPF